MKKILYVEDMVECYEKTKDALGRDYFLDWKKNYMEGVEALGELEAYQAGIFDVNLNYDAQKSSEQQTKEGLELIKITRFVKGINFPIICVSAMNNEEEALRNGANKFMWKKEFWNNGKKVLEDLIKK